LDLRLLGFLTAGEETVQRALEALVTTLAQASGEGAWEIIIPSPKSHSLRGGMRVTLQEVWGPQPAYGYLWPQSYGSSFRDGLYRSRPLAENGVVASRLRFWKALEEGAQVLRMERENTEEKTPPLPTCDWTETDWKRTPILAQGKWVGIVTPGGWDKWRAIRPRPNQGPLWGPLSRRELSRLLKAAWGVAPEMAASEDSTSESSSDRRGTAGRGGGRKREKGQATEMDDRVARLEAAVNRLTEALTIQNAQTRPPPEGGLN
jgi:hypothetical protein